MGSARCPVRWEGPEPGGGLFDYRQLDRESGATGRLILDAECAAVVPHYAVANAQPQPCVLADILRWEERVEELGDALFRDHEVERDLLDLVWIGHGHGEAGLEIGLELDVVYHKAIFAQIEHRLDGLGDRGVVFSPLPPRANESRFLTMRTARSASLLGGWIEVLFGSEELGVVPDAGQRIVELVLQWRR